MEDLLEDLFKLICLSFFDISYYVNKEVKALRIILQPMLMKAIPVWTFKYILNK